MSRKSERVKKWRKAFKARIIKAFGGKCLICGYDKCEEAFDLHHIDPSKKSFGLGSVRANSIAWERVIVELRKCVLLCKNCHAEFHAGKTHLPENLVMFDETFTDYKELERKDFYDPCPICGKLKYKTNITCSRQCAGVRSYVVDWINVDVIHEIDVNGKSYTGLADELGISDSGVRKRYLKEKKKLE